jgi:O-antigen/teichoic acid export membrane protein
VQYFAATNWGGDKYIISKDSISDIDVNRVFSFEIALALVLFLIYVVFFHENFIAYLGLEKSNYLLFAMGLCFCYHPLSRCKALLERSKNFVHAYSPLFIANIISLILGYVSLMNGLGLLSMVIWKVSSYVLELLILFFLAPKIPRLSANFFSTLSLAILFVGLYFWVGLDGFIGINLDYYLVSTLMGPEQLGLYWMAFSFSSILIVFRDAITRLLLPILAREIVKRR